MMIHTAQLTRRLVCCVLVLALTGILAGCSGGSAPDADSPFSGSASGDKDSYGNNEFKIKPPQGWIVNERGGLRDLVKFTNPVTDFDEYVPYAANVSVFQEPVVGYSLDEYIQPIKKAAQRDLGEYRVIEDERVRIDGQEGHFLGATFLLEEVPEVDLKELGLTALLRSRSLILIDEGIAYVITATALEGFWFKYGDVFDASLRSFKLD